MAKKGFIIGLIAGAAAALALAPKKGSEFREDVKNRYDDFKEDPQTVLADTLGDLRDFSVDRFYDVKEKFDSGEYSAEKAKEYLLDKKEFIQAKVESGELSVDSVRDFFTKTKDKLAQRFQSDVEDENSDAGDLSVNYSWTEDEADKSKDEEW
ncbi:MAG: YtxH domain-containing protein [Streptococcaceae bacterium]|jgi:gas vesicle protein|nr:YtxH domain-containing protein [Streptococcaceae bacterium]